MVESYKVSVNIRTLIVMLAGLFAATPAVSALMANVSMGDIAREADVILIGNVTYMESRWNPGRTTIYTYVTLSAKKYIKGTGQKTLTIVTEGGQVGNDIILVEDTPEFTKNETVLVFLTRGKGDFTVTGWVQGKYVVEGRNVRNISGERTPLDVFLRRIGDAILQDGATPTKTQAAPGFGVISGFLGLLVVCRKLVHFKH